LEEKKRKREAKQRALRAARKGRESQSFSEGQGCMAESLQKRSETSRVLQCAMQDRSPISKRPINAVREVITR